MVDTKQQEGCWSSNELAIWADFRQSYLCHLRAALEDMEAGLAGRSEKELELAAQAKSSMNKSFNRANQSSFRTDALINEVLILRKGLACSYCSPEEDPTRDDFCFRPILSKEANDE